jgi:hypothetical protein
MARSINSPGIQVTETDLSNYQQIGGGTTVFVPGFAAQGPTDETLLITSVAELEQIYGTPTTAAERYFYYSCREVLNSPGTLLTSRLPYGSGSGEGFFDQYSALVYPVLTGYTSQGIETGLTTDWTIGEPFLSRLDIDSYERLLQNNFEWKDLAVVASTTTTVITALSTLTVVNASVTAIDTTLDIIQNLIPTPQNINVQYNVDVVDFPDVTFTFDVTARAFKFDATIGKIRILSPKEILALKPEDIGGLLHFLTDPLPIVKNYAEAGVKVLREIPVLEAQAGGARRGRSCRRRQNKKNRKSRRR